MGVMEARRRILLNIPHLVTTTPASVASFDTDMVGKLKSAKFSFLPVQDLHGYDSPWPADGGKNLFDYSKATFTTSVPSYGITITVNAPIITISGTFPQTITNASFNVVANYSDDSLSGKSYICQAMDVVGGTIVGIWGFRTATEKAIGINIGPHNEGDTVNISFKLSVAASSQTSWSPYSNICPISGWDGLTVTRCGKNLFDINGDTSLIYDGVAIQNNRIVISSIGSGATSRVYFSTLYKPGTYTFSCKFSGDIEEIRIFSTTPFTDGTYNAYYGGYFKRLSNGSTTVTVTEQFTIGVIASGVARSQGTIYDLQLEPGSIATAYEPYTGTTLPVMIPAAGKNLVDVSKITGNNISVSNGVITVDSTASGTSTSVKLSQVAPSLVAGGTYTLSFIANDALSYIWLKNGNLGGRWDNGTSHTVTQDELDSNFKFYGAGTITNFQIESGSTATTYEPYTNFVYGGYVDICKGKLVAEWTGITAEFAENEGTFRDDKRLLYANVTTGYVNETKRPSLIANIGKYGSGSVIPYCYVTNLGETGKVQVQWGIDSSFTGAITAQVAYPLANPIEYTLTPQIIKSLKGANNMWSTGNGDAQVTYWTH